MGTKIKDYTWGSQIDLKHQPWDYERKGLTCAADRAYRYRGKCLALGVILR